MRKIDLEHSLGTAIFLASKSLERAGEYRIKKELGLTPLQWKVIMTLKFINGISQKELADKIYIDASTLVPVIDKMGNGGLIERRPDPKDRRKNLIFLTKKSESTVDSIIEIIIKIRKEIYKGISEKEQVKTQAILRKIIDNTDNVLNKK